MNGIRQLFAAVILLLGFGWACNKRYIRYILLVLLLSTIHKSILIVIPLMFLFTGKRWNKGIVFFVLFCAFSVFVPGPINAIIGGLASDEYARYLENYQPVANVFHVFIEAVPLVMGLMYHFNRKKRTEENRVVDVLINMQAISFGFMTLAMTMAQYARIGMYMRHAGALLIPLLIPHIFKEDNVGIAKVLAVILYLLAFIIILLYNRSFTYFYLDFSIIRLL